MPSVSSSHRLRVKIVDGIVQSSHGGISGNYWLHHQDGECDTPLPCHAESLVDTTVSKNIQQLLRGWRLPSLPGRDPGM
jgi:hypothetical protein